MVASDGTGPRVVLAPQLKAAADLLRRVMMTSMMLTDDDLYDVVRDVHRITTAQDTEM